MPWISGNRYLTLEETENNGFIVYRYFIDQGWTDNAVCAMLGNMQAESGINPGIWESLIPYGTGYGLTQWTMYTKYSNWAIANGYPDWEDNGQAEMECVLYFVTVTDPNDPLFLWSRNNELGIDPPITFPEFTQSTLDIHTLSNYWLWFYEHPLDPGPSTQATRQAYTDAWWDRTHGTSTIPAWLLKQFIKQR